MFDLSIIDWLLAAVAVYLFGRLLSRRQLGQLPPGPKRMPIIGNLLDWPKDAKEWETFAHWQREYGPCPVALVD